MTRIPLKVKVYVLFILSASMAGSLAWVVNLSKLVDEIGVSEYTLMTALRAAGVFFPPLGVVMAFF